MQIVLHRVRPPAAPPALGGRHRVCRILVILGIDALSKCIKCGQLLFLLEPPTRLVFSNSTGARAACAAHGSPAPVVTWLAEDGAPLSDVPGLRFAVGDSNTVYDMVTDDESCLQ
ncbi:Down syndrome cell adhesion molecule-like protein Dscam2 [Eumeta japonica]|uniref:Down syndrome cell adhesion molecule-like protein Dscam2 n=1 Tax=Eumeta variegata TaxID=151549 RepID=A0A4C1SA98_EUMVA|nr:Down syndrome cell adhesion molecule-like protein Dscam2 [Eumeta japonica]